MATLPPLNFYGTLRHLLLCFPFFWTKLGSTLHENEPQSAFEDDIVRTLLFRVNTLCDCLAGFRV